MKMYVFFVVIVVAGLFVGCQSPASEQTPPQAIAPQETAASQPAPQQTSDTAPAPQSTPQPDETGETRITADTLDRVTGQTWTLQSMTIDGSESPLSPPLPTLKLEKDYTLAGQSFINRYFGSFQLDRQGRLQWPAPIGATRMAGNLTLLKLELDYLRVLPKTDRINLDDSRLVLSNQSGDIRLVYTPAP